MNLVSSPFLACAGATAPSLESRLSPVITD